MKTILDCTNDDLSCFKNKSRPELGETKKKICRTVKGNGSKITIETILHITDYGYETFNVKTGK